MSLSGRCLCGAVTVTVPARPEVINICNCRSCRALGMACGYYRPEEVSIAGETGGFVRNDIAETWLTQHFCPTCGSVTHWSPLPHAPLGRMGVNMRLFALDDLAGIPALYQDGRSVETDEDPFVTIATGTIGDGKAF